MSFPTSHDKNRWILAIDSSTETASLAVKSDERIYELNWPAGREQTSTILAEIDRLRSLAGIEIDRVGAVAVAIGPGMFNGLRVGMSVAKGFVLGLDVPLIGIPSLEAAAHPYDGLGVPVIAAAAAGRGRFVWAVYENRRLFKEPANGTIDAIAEHAAVIGKVIVTGEFSDDQAAELSSIRGVKMPPAAGRIRRASSLAEIAWERWRDGNIDDVVELEPIYLHAPKN